jgi:AbrB family looped-hinge helix DNA binding protein
MAHTALKSHVRIEGKGRVVIPEWFRSALGLKVGDEIDLRIEGNEFASQHSKTGWQGPGSAC